jgi:hypothetical protein
MADQEPTLWTQQVTHRLELLKIQHDQVIGLLRNHAAELRELKRMIETIADCVAVLSLKERKWTRKSKHPNSESSATSLKS